MALKLRQLRRRARRVIEKRFRRDGVPLPEHFECEACKGTGRRWRLLSAWCRWMRCRVCLGTGRDLVPALTRLEDRMLAHMLGQGKP